MALAQALGAQAQPLDRTGGEVMQKDIAGGDQPLDDRLRRRVLHIEGDAFLRAVGPDKVR